MTVGVVPVPLWPLQWLGMAVAVALAAMALLIVGRSLRAERWRRKKAAVRPAIRGALFDRLGRDSPDWEAWTNDLTAAEREVLRELVNDYLRLMSGHDRERLGPLVSGLELDSWALDTLETGDRYAKLVALEWLALIDHPPVPTLLARVCAGDDDLRAAGARVVVEREYPNAPERGIRLLLDGKTGPLSAFGLDTLYQTAKSSPDQLLAYARAHHGEWDPALLAQVFLVLEHVGPIGTEADLTWIIDRCEHDSPTVRAGAVRSLADSGWQAEIRAGVPVDRLVADPSPAVRRATYRTLGDWSDTAACATLYRAARRESFPANRLVAVTELYRGRCREELGTAVRREFPRLWDWVEATETTVGVEAS